MSTTVVSRRSTKTRKPRKVAAKKRAPRAASAALQLDSDEIALHRAISAAVARDLGR